MLANFYTNPENRQASPTRKTAKNTWRAISYFLLWEG